MNSKYHSRNLDHLGIVSQICDEIGIVETIDRILPPDSNMRISYGECIKLMVINGLGFTSRPLYLEAQFFSSRPVNRFLMKDCEDAINDDRLRRTLDKVFAAGCDPLFASIASQAALRFGVSKKFRHLDSTSMQVHGEYDNREGIGLVTFGYSKDHRPDLKQFMIYLMSSQDGDVPLLAKTVAGNTSDKQLFRERLKELQGQIRAGEHVYFIADSALYTRTTIEDLSSSMKWITRVPETLSETKKIIQYAGPLEDLASGGYQGKEFTSEYGGVKQRWLLVYSEQAYLREEKTLKKQIQKEKERKTRELNQWSRTDFDCEKDAKEALLRWSSKLKYHCLEEITVESKKVHGGKGRPKEGASVSYRYRIKTTLKEDATKIDPILKTKGRFIIATNELDEELLTSQELLQNYKGQQSVERGFRFLKEPAFMTPAVFLKSQKRIIALAMVMCLCLLVYMIAQRYLRQRLKQAQASVPNQLGKATRTPTMRWIFQLFEGVHLLIHKTRKKTEEIILNMNPVRCHVLAILGPQFEKIYSNN